MFIMSIILTTVILFSIAGLIVYLEEKDVEKKEEMEETKHLRIQSVEERVKNVFGSLDLQENYASIREVHRSCCKIELKVMVDDYYHIEEAYDFVTDTISNFLCTYKNDFKTFDAKAYDFIVLIERKNVYFDMEVLKEVLFHFPGEDLNKINWNNCNKQNFYRFIENFTKEAYTELQEALSEYC